MQTILRILERAGGYRPALYLKIENPPYMALGHRSHAGAGAVEPAFNFRCALRRTERRPDARPGDVFRVVEAAALRPCALGLVLPQRLHGRGAVFALSGRGELRFPSRPLRAARAIRAAVGQESPRTGFSRSLYGQVDSRLVRSLRSGTGPMCLRSVRLHPSTARKEHTQMETTVINATEYRDLPLSQLNESKTNPRRVFDDAALQRTRTQHPQPGRAFALAGSATHRERLRDRSRSAALSRRADGRSLKPCRCASSICPMPKSSKRNSSRT